jgi:hypothetical protein
MVIIAFFFSLEFNFTLTPVYVYLKIGGKMRKQRIEYDSPVDALVAIAKQLSIFEARYEKISEDFFDDYNKGQKEKTLWKTLIYTD